MNVPRYMAVADTDIGISRATNQDSVLMKHGRTPEVEVLLVAICDGMGGLAKGEVASATVIRAFADWFDRELPFELALPDLNAIAGKWSLMLKDLNVRIGRYGKREGIRLGTTFTGVLFLGDSYLTVHVGDSRFYSLTTSLKQLTTDQTFVAREVARGTMTVGQARTDKRRNLLLQCVGASDSLEPEILFGKVERGAYLLCSDGFRHEIRPEEIYEFLNPMNLVNREVMHGNVKCLIEQAKRRRERDNISVALIKAE